MPIIKPSVNDQLDPHNKFSRRLRRKQYKLRPHNASVNIALWDAEVIKVERCSSVEYLSDTWHRIFEYSREQKNNRYYLEGAGNSDDLVLTLYQTLEFGSDRNTIKTFPFPVPDAKISLRLYDANALIEIFTDPTGNDTVSDYWAVFLRGHNEQSKIDALNMLRRLEGLARAMPNDWFSYRNFFTVPGEATDTRIPAEIAEGQHAYQMAGGMTLQLTGVLATRQALELFGHRNFRLTGNVHRPTTRSMTRARSQVSKVSNTVADRSNKQSAKAAKKAAKAAKKAARREVRMMRKFSPLGSSLSEVVLTPQTGHQAQQSEGVPKAATDQNEFPSSSGTVQGDINQSDKGQSDSEEYPIKGILEENVDEDGQPIYLVSWERESFEDSWEPEENISLEALKVFRLAEQKKTLSKKRKPKKKARGRPAKKSKK
ncbi:MAG: hypothetical protein Q9224_005726 [Gallowayella concinna]